MLTSSPPSTPTTVPRHRPRAPAATTAPALTRRLPPTTGSGTVSASSVTRGLSSPALASSPAAPFASGIAFISSGSVVIHGFRFCAPSAPAAPSAATACAVCARPAA